MFQQTILYDGLNFVPNLLVWSCLFNLSPDVSGQMFLRYLFYLFIDIPTLFKPTMAQSLVHYLLNSFLGCLFTIAGMLCIVQLAAQQNWWCAIDHSPCQRNCSPRVFVCCCFSWVQKTVQAVHVYGKLLWETFDPYYESKLNISCECVS